MPLPPPPTSLTSASLPPPPTPEGQVFFACCSVSYCVWVDTFEEDYIFVGDDNEDVDDDDSKHLPDDYYACSSKHSIYFNFLILKVTL